MDVGVIFDSVFETEIFLYPMCEWPNSSKRKSSSNRVIVHYVDLRSMDLYCPKQLWYFPAVLLLRRTYLTTGGTAGKARHSPPRGNFVEIGLLIVYRASRGPNACPTLLPCARATCVIRHLFEK